jgi:predicted RNA-binding Zn-ribbon protein involved in translation (DUF1610 family)
MSQVNRTYTQTNDWNEDAFRQYLTMGIACARAGERREAANWLQRATVVKAKDARPWLWLARTTDDPYEKEDFLNTALSLDPFDVEARREMALLKGLINPKELLPLGQGLAPSHPAEPEAAKMRAFLCPSCGGSMKYESYLQAMRCERCGNTRRVEEQNAANDERALEFVLPTARGHRWAEAHHLMTCTQCGATSLLPPTQVTVACPFCGSDALIESSETAGLLEPQAIAPLRIQQRGAEELLLLWLKQQLGDKADDVEVAPVRAAYYPFWTFDATYAIRRGTSELTNLDDRPHDSQNFMQFDDVLVSGTSKISSEILRRLEPFKLTEVAAFKPEFLAGWATLAYDRSLADASIEARGQMVQEARRQMFGGNAPGRFSDFTYKQVLLPLWVGSYLSEGRSYSVQINGQTGRVGGQRPGSRGTGLLTRLFGR